MLTPKMRAQVERCQPIGRSNNGCFAPRPQVQVSAELPSSYPLYTVDSSTYMCPSVRVMVSVPNLDEGWGEYEIVFRRAVPRHELPAVGGPVALDQATFDAQVQAVVEEARTIAAQYAGWEAR